jgi:hypothetical protein
MSPDEFRECVKTQLALDMEVWDVALLQPLKEFYGWWNAQSTATQRFLEALAGAYGAAATAFLARALKRALATFSAEVSLAFAEAVVAVSAGIALGTFVDAVGRCRIMEVEEIV